MQKRTKDALKVAGITLVGVFIFLPGTWQWAKARLMGDEAAKKKAEEWGKKTEDTFKK